MLSIRYKSCIKSWRNQKRSTKNKQKFSLFINKYNLEGINFPSEKDDSKIFEKYNLKNVLNVLHAKKEKYILPMSQNITQIVKNKLLF